MTTTSDGDRTAALRDWAADWGLGGVVNALEVIEKQHGLAPDAIHDAGLALTAALQALGLTAGDNYRASDIWRPQP